MALGTHPIIAVYSGDVNHATSKSSTLNQQILQGPANSLVSSLNPSTSGKSVTLTASLQGVAGLVPTGAVTFKDGGTVLTAPTSSRLPARASITCAAESGIASPTSNTRPGQTLPSASFTPGATAPASAFASVSDPSPKAKRMKL
jgi:hypothetical protein